VGDNSSPTPFALGFHFAKVWVCEERREVRDLPDLPKSGRMFGWFSHLVDS
jgi:hypothetical protein